MDFSWYRFLMCIYEYVCQLLKYKLKGMEKRIEINNKNFVNKIQTNKYPINTKFLKKSTQTGFLHPLAAAVPHLHSHTP